MITVSSWFRLALFVLPLSTVACSGSKNMSWEEEVILSDGRVIVARQARRYERAYNGNAMANVPREAWMSFRLPGISGEEIHWHENLLPLVVNTIGGRLYVVGLPFTQREAIQYGNPHPPYVCFIFKDNGWTRIKLEDLPVELYDTNMYLRTAPQHTGLISSVEKVAFRKEVFISDMKRLDPRDH